MVFNSAIFLIIFFPISILIYYMLNDKLKNIYLCALSLFFYAWGEPKNIIWLLISIVVNYLLALLLGYSKYKKNKVLSVISLSLGVIYNLGLLFIFKYLNFTITNINAVFSKDIAIQKIALPLGVSFFVFKSMSYIFDVNTEKIKAEKNILHYALYISFFPQLIAGPITRYSDVGSQIKSRKVTLDKFYTGVIRFMTGFSKKVLLSDQLIDPVATIFNANGFSAPCAWLGAIAYTLEIYFDFSGYSDMAIGLGMMLGFDTNENFDTPYITTSVQEFWRRWHISLSTWFRDYIYFPLGGSRCNTFRVILNTTIVFFLTGLWHGASWNFIVWGLFYVIFMIPERLFLKKWLEKIPKFFRHVYALFIIIIGWVFFRADNLTNAVIYIKNMFTFNSNSFIDFVRVVDIKLIVCMILGVLFSSSFAIFVKTKFAKKELPYNIFITICFLIAISYMWARGFSPFLYARF